MQRGKDGAALLLCSQLHKVLSIDLREAHTSTSVPSLKVFSGEVKFCLLAGGIYLVCPPVTFLMFTCTVSLPFFIILAQLSH